MAVERSPSGSSLIDVLDRVLDKGIVIDAWVRVSLAGIDLLTVEARVIVASIETYLQHAHAVAHFENLATRHRAALRSGSRRLPRVPPLPPIPGRGGSSTKRRRS
jgi:hypothetical protein